MALSAADGDISSRKPLNWFKATDVSLGSASINRRQDLEFS
jgi:hypothetical protein